MLPTLCLRVEVPTGIVGGVSGARWSHRDGLGARGVVDEAGAIEEGCAHAAGTDPLPVRSLPALCWAWGMGRAARALTETQSNTRTHARTHAHTAET